MLTELIAQETIATIKLAQTTFSHLQIDGKLYKLAYKHKAEAFMKPGVQGLISLYQRHPMLLHYNEPKVAIYIASRADDPAGVSQEIEEAIGGVLHGWRDWRIDLFGNNKAAAAHLFQENLRDGYGILLGGAPVSVARAMLAVCDRHSIRTTILGDLDEVPSEPPIYSLLTIGPCHAIAKGFDCKPL